MVALMMVWLTTVDILVFDVNDADHEEGNEGYDSEFDDGMTY